MNQCAIAPAAMRNAIPLHSAGLRDLAKTLHQRGRTQDAELLLEHLAALDPYDAETLRQLVRLLGAEKRTLEALQKLAALKTASTDAETLLDDIRRQMDPAIQCFNAHLSAGEVEQAEKYAAALADLIPRNPALLEAVLSCNLALGRKDKAAHYAAALLSLNSNHAIARAVIAERSPNSVHTTECVDEQAALASKQAVHPLIALRDIHDAASAILCQPLTGDGIKQVSELLKTAGELAVDVPPGSEWEIWEKHYRLMLDAIDLRAVQNATPKSNREPPISLMSSSGAALNWRDVQAKAARLKARTVFFAAADRSYVDLYARYYINSILKHCDVPFLVVLHVIGGAGELKEVVKSLGIRDNRLIFAGDGFDAAGVSTQCYDTPPKGLIKKPVAHLQSVRFLRLGALLRNLKLPVFVSDIDLLLQRGVKDLLDRCIESDVVFNENDVSSNAGSRLTANLLLLNPTKNAALFVRFLRDYLERMLSRRNVTRWIDQFGLLMARHHLALTANHPRIGYFDTASDINNVMYPSYQENPFRFLSLYHGFDTSSLEGNPAVTPKDAQSKKRPRKVKRKTSIKRKTLRRNSAGRR